MQRLSYCDLVPRITTPSLKRFLSLLLWPSTAHDTLYGYFAIILYHSAAFFNPFVIPPFGPIYHSDNIHWFISFYVLTIFAGIIFFSCNLLLFALANALSNRLPYLRYVPQTIHIGLIAVAIWWGGYIVLACYSHYPECH